MPTKKNKGVRGFRGALVHKLSSQTVKNSGYVTFDFEDYDTDGIHDNAVNNSRLIVPPNVTVVRLTANLDLANAPEYYICAIHKNSATAYGLPMIDINGSRDVRTRINLVSAPIIVLPGDYFEVYVSAPYVGGENILVDHTWHYTWFSMEIIG